MPIIYLTIFIIYMVLVLWSSYNLGRLPISKKIIYIVIQLVIVFVITNISYIVSKQNIEYQSQDIMNNIKFVLILIFTGVNGLLLIPISCKQIEKYEEENIDRTRLLKRLVLNFILLIIISYFECEYMTTTQKGILQIITNKT